MDSRPVGLLRLAAAASQPSPGERPGFGQRPAPWETHTGMADRRRKLERVMLDVRRRCLVCDFEEQVSEPEHTDVVGPGCTRCHAPSERVEILARRVEPIARNPHAAALGRLGGQRGGPARAAALSPRRRREIARAAARARWSK